MKRTKIICTIGPATESKPKIKSLIRAGMNVARLNFSHGSYEHHSMLIKNIRDTARELGQPIGIIQDLQGPRIRLGKLAREGVSVKRGDMVTFIYEPDLKKTKITFGSIVLPVQVKLHEIVKKGETILIKDGLVRMEAALVEKNAVVAKVEQGDVLTSNRGINLPESNLPDVVLTAKDREDVKFGLKQKVDYLALSFVRDAKDIRALRGLLPKRGEYLPQIIAKIERKEAVVNFDEILGETDAVMVARGDLGIEMPADEIPLIQKDLIAKCRMAAKTVIVATQMLESMTLNPRPTRAEVSDVANAVIDHTDAVMLSGETASGKYPVAACRIMRQICEETEASRYDDVTTATSVRPAKKKNSGANLVGTTIKEMVDNNPIKAVVAVSSTGHSARLISSQRPEAIIAALTQSATIWQQLALVWGVRPFIIKRCRTVDELIDVAVKLVKKELKIKPGEKIIIASGHPTGPHGELNLLKIHTI